MVFMQPSLRKNVIAIVIISLGWLICFSACRPQKVYEAQATGKVETTASKPNAAVTTKVNAAIGFRTRRNLEEHYEKHGHEFGSISQEEYLRQAQTLRDAQVGGDILEAKRSDGVTTRFDRKAGTFLAFNEDATIRTFFKPNDGERYFKRQLR